MLLQRFAPTTVCALLLLAAAPLGAPAQTQEHLKAAPAERRGLTVPGVETGPTLKALFAESASRAGAGGLNETDLKRFEKMRQREDAQSEPDEKWSKRKKVLMIVAIIGVVALTAWAIANSVENPRSFCDTAPWDPDCIP